MLVLADLIPTAPCRTIGRCVNVTRDTKGIHSLDVAKVEILEFYKEYRNVSFQRYNLTLDWIVAILTHLLLDQIEVDEDAYYEVNDYLFFLQLLSQCHCHAIHRRVARMQFAKNETELVRVAVYPTTPETRIKDVDQNVFKIQTVFIRRLV